MKKVLLIGLDCAASQLIFDGWLNELPNIKRLFQGGISARELALKE